MPNATPSKPEDFRQICFVIMPFDKKEVRIGDETRKIDFDKVYKDIFEPSIAEVELPAEEGGGKLIPKRADSDFHTGLIDQEMFEFIEFSRFAVADITGLNANVFYELGARHRAHESGTAIFRHADVLPPFDIKAIKAFPYAIDPAEEVEKSIATIRRVLTESLQQNAWDSPVMLALRRLKEEMTVDLKQLLIDAENAVREGKEEHAHELWMKATQLDPHNPLHFIKASAYPKQQGEWEKTIQLLHQALAAEKSFGTARTESSYSDAWRELGIAQNKLEGKAIPSSGREALERAVHYAVNDFDAWASLGGILRRIPDLEGAVKAYEKSVEVSDGHPYPLLMAIKLRANLSGKFELAPETYIQLGRAEGFRKAQVENVPPIDVPWSFFDLTETLLYQKKTEQALEIAKKGFEESEASWMPGTFITALEMLPEGADIPGLDQVLELARKRKAELEAAGK
jgi:tetratricopeptide (TPR) repeat protein